MDKHLRVPLIAGNWKMNLLPSDVRPFGERLLTLLAGGVTCRVAICAPFVMLPAAQEVFAGSPVLTGAQNVSHLAKGAYTGEVSIPQLQDLGVRCVIIGHSERRQYYGETDTFVAKKARALLDAGMTPIICVGESLEQREAGITFEHIAIQVKLALAEIRPEELRDVVIAYEPVWAIGTGKTATAEQAEAVCAAIRGTAGALFGTDNAQRLTVQYGGSMNGGNAAELLAKENIDGGLIGGASLDADQFFEIIKAANA